MRHKKIIERIGDILTSKNHRVVYEWSKSGSLKPYNENGEACSIMADEIGRALRDVDVFVLISDEGGTDMFIELGIVIGRWLDDTAVRIYAVGNNNDRSLMHFHPAIRQRDTLRDVFSSECPELLDREIVSLSAALNERRVT